MTMRRMRERRLARARAALIVMIFMEESLFVNSKNLFFSILMRPTTRRKSRDGYDEESGMPR